ncbi:MAG: polysaccharide biosynthesis/export family protein [Chloracidobacterium sp.]|nr:polysaccharide biosynthesis/export family protein [Chloracidobacterium sp.]
MKVPNKRLMIIAAASMLFTSMAGFAQISGSSKRNNPYSPSPAGRNDEKQVAVVSAKIDPVEAVFIMQSQNSPILEERPNIAQTTVKFAKRIESNSRTPTEIYKVGIGDVLLINLKNSPQGSRYCTVRSDGTINFPLAGEGLIAAGQTVEVIEEMLASGITLFPDPQIEVRVREFGSHKITISGLVENPGEKNLQREAMPLYAIRSEAVVSPKATKALIRRAPLVKLESYDLENAETDNVLIYPGNSVEFISDNRSKSYYITGEVNSTGQKDYSSGLTLYQAVIAAGGAKGNPKKAMIGRKDDKGLFSSTEYNLRSIKDGKAADPVLESGDVIEIRK